MAKIFLILALVVFGNALRSPADTYRLEGLDGNRYQPPTNVQVVWKVTNDLPASLWVYKVIPQNFPMSVISNLMAIGEFRWRDLTKKTDPFVPDKNLIRFVDKKENWTRYLEIAPTFGWIEFNADDNGSPKESVEGVPERDKVEKLALGVLFEMGIDRSLLCNMQNDSETIQGKLSHDGQKLTTNVISRGISFGRRIDGVESRNGRCFKMDFGNHAKIRNFSLSWRNLSPFESHPLATPDEIKDSIKGGHAVLPIQSYDWTDAENAKTLTVLEATPLYFDREGMKPLDFMYPYAALKVKADFGNSRTAIFYLECPILSTNTTSHEARQSFPKADVVPSSLHPTNSKPQLIGGQPTLPVSDAYARAFLNDILPQLSDFISAAGLNIPTPVTTNQVVATNYACRIFQGQPLVQLYLTNGDRFNYQQGHFDAFYAHDAMDIFPDTGRAENFLGHINMTTNEAIARGEGVIKNLGYNHQLPTPIISYAFSRSSLPCTRYTYYWKHPDQDFPFASIEVDMETKTIKSIFLKDAAFEKKPDTGK